MRSTFGPSSHQNRTETQIVSLVDQEPEVAHGKRMLTQQAFDKLLSSFSPNRDEAGKQYEMIRVKLVRFFEWHSCSSPDDQADETINRVARRIAEGQQIDNLNGYFYGVARLVFMEALKEKAREPLPLEAVQTKGEPIFEEDDSEPRLRCFDHCLNQLPPGSRSLIMEYYQEERRAKIELRKQLADSLRIPLNALRIRAHRIRVSLEKCITECLGQHA